MRLIARRTKIRDPAFVTLVSCQKAGSLSCLRRPLLISPVQLGHSGRVLTGLRVPKGWMVQGASIRNPKDPWRTARSSKALNYPPPLYLPPLEIPEITQGIRNSQSVEQGSNGIYGQSIRSPKVPKSRVKHVFTQSTPEIYGQHILILEVWMIRHNLLKIF